MKHIHSFREMEIYCQDLAVKEKNEVICSVFSMLFSFW